MKKLDKVHFSTHARIKDVLGRDLINNDNVAIIELIKNSRDAGSKSVSISFFNAEAEESPFSQLIIQDSGSGMNIDDIKYKWLNIAYSDKRLANVYRSVPYAGNKGIGRFSCDRLGETLELFTRVRNGDLIYVEIDWADFEIDDRDKKVSDIRLSAYRLTDSEFASQTGIEKLKNGTILIIKSLRSTWDIKKLRGLRKELERFAIDRERRFKVYLNALDYKDEKDLNGLVENKIFDKLDFRTTSIHSSIDKYGKKIKITLKHNANEVFTLIEKNPFGLLSNIDVALYYLNQPAKAYFKRETGYSVKDFGSVFLFLNGFRVTPYGEPGNDWLSIDFRKAQGFKRLLGTRDIVGFVEITDKKYLFKATSSREGLVSNDAYNQLVSNQLQVTSSLDSTRLYGYVQNLLRKHQRFVVEGLDWDRIKRVLSQEGEDLELTKYEFQNRDKNILESLASIIHLNSIKENIFKVTFNKKYLIQLAAKEISSYDVLLKDLKEKFKGLPISQLKPLDKKDIYKYIERQAKALKAKEATAIRLQKRIAKAEKTAEQLTSENLFLRAQSNEDLDDIINLHHQTIDYASTINTEIQNFRHEISEKIDTKTIKGFLDKIEYLNNKVLKISRLATHANFRMSSAKKKGELFTFIKKYLVTLSEHGITRDLEITDKIPEHFQLVRRFRPLELTMAIDNFLANAKKAEASRIQFGAKKEGSSFLITISDNGNGLSKDIEYPDSIFEKGVTTTKGSGLGLYFLKEIVTQDLEGEVSVVNRAKGRFTIGIKLK